jgi:hypothetical protein
MGWSLMISVLAQRAVSEIPCEPRALETFCPVAREKIEEQCSLDVRNKDSRGHSL